MADQDYIFISYKGEDPEALEIIRRLKRDGYRIWYDDGILPSDEWPTEIAERIEGSSYFITLVTDAFLRSIWFSKELTFAQKYKKPILPVYLTDAPLPKGPAFILVDLRGVYRSACRSDDALYQEIYKAKGLDAFRSQPEKKASPAPVSKPAPKPAPAEPKAPEQKGEIITFPNGNVYEGEVLDGKPHGHGTMTYAKDNKSKLVSYVGAWKNGLRHGHGTMTWNSGNVFDGLWVDGSREGHGVLRWSSGNVYDGDWKQGKRCGQGKMTWTSGDVYEGEWADGKRSGQGKMTWKSGAVYDGGWAEDKRSGHGVLRYADGSVKEGEWKGDQLIEKTEVLYDDGSRYFGETLDDAPHGSGTMTYAPDDQWQRKAYTGEWKDGLRHGKGRMEWTFGDVYDGDWVDGQMCGKGVYQFADGRLYSGDWKNGKQHGKGIFKDTNGMTYSGPFVDGMQEGEFTVYPSQNPGAARKVIYHEDQPVDESAQRTARKLHIGRNDPCPCGKIKANGMPYKYKECCGRDKSS